MAGFRGHCQKSASSGVLFSASYQYGMCTGGREEAYVWTTRYMDLALTQIKHERLAVQADDVARLSPLGFAHINLVGRYHFTLPEAIAQGAVRVLRDPATAEADDHAP